MRLGVRRLGGPHRGGGADVRGLLAEAEGRVHRRREEKGRGRDAGDAPVTRRVDEGTDGDECDGRAEGQARAENAHRAAALLDGEPDAGHFDDGRPSARLEPPVREREEQHERQQAAPRDVDRGRAENPAEGRRDRGGDGAQARDAGQGGRRREEERRTARAQHADAEDAACTESFGELSVDELPDRVPKLQGPEDEPDLERAEPERCLDRVSRGTDVDPAEVKRTVRRPQDEERPRPQRRQPVGSADRCASGHA